MNLTGSQRKKLRGIAHSLRPLIHIGKRGLTDEVVQEIDHALEVHELIKIRFSDFKEAKTELCEKIQAETHSHNVGIIGHNAIFFRQHPDPDKRHAGLLDL